MSRRLAVNWVCLWLVSLGAGAAANRELVVETVAGSTWQGLGRLTNGAVVVDESNVVAMAQLRRLSFELPPPTNAPPPGKGNGLLGYYFARSNFQGSVTARLDERVDFDWGTGEPAPGVPADGFSAMWSGDIQAPVDGVYRFSIVADDAAELLVSNQVLVPFGLSGKGQEIVGPGLELPAGTRIPLLLKFRDLAGPAAMKLFWEGPGIPHQVVPMNRLYAKSRVPGQTSELLGTEGWLATYYASADFSGGTFTRVDPRIDFNWADRDPVAGVSRSQYSVRWQGQLKPDFTETYTIYVTGDEPMRVWIDGRPFILPGVQYYLTEVRESMPLVAGERYDVRIEGISTSGNATMKVMWSSPSTPKNVIPSTHVSPVSPVAGASGVSPGRAPRGCLLADGDFVGLPADRATASAVRTGGWLRSNPISTVNLARIYCQPVSRAMLERIPPGRPGLLLAKGDFVDGEFQAIENGEVRIGSVLFGVKSYNAGKDVLAVVLRDARPKAAPFEIRLRDQSVLGVDEPQLESGALRFRKPALGSCRIDWSDVVSIRRRP